MAGRIKALIKPDYQAEYKRAKEQGDERPYEEIKNELYKLYFINSIKNRETCLVKVADFTNNAFLINGLPDADRRRLGKKYLPAADYLRDFLLHLSDETHPLFEFKDMLLERTEHFIREEAR